MKARTGVVIARPKVPRVQRMVVRSLPSDFRYSNLAHRLAPCIALVVPFLVYTATMAPSITWRNGGIDSGDLATGVAILDFIHPPGYPLFVLLAHGFWRILPGSDPAFATNLFCGLLAAISSTIVYVAGLAYLDGHDATREYTILLKTSAALAAALALATGPLWWQQANLATVHAGNLLLASLALLCFVWVWRRAMTWRLALFCGCVLGFATTHHLTLLGLIAAFVAATITGVRWLPVARIHFPVSRKALFAGICGLLMGLAPWGILWWLGDRTPTHVWGDPTTYRGFIDVIFARQYHDLLASPTFTSVLYRSSRAMWTLARELGLLGFPAGLGGLALLWETDRRYVRFLLFSAAIYIAFFAFYSARDVESYLLPVAVAMMPALAHGLARGMHWARHLKPSYSAPTIVLSPIVTVGLGIALSFSSMNLRQDREAINYARGALMEAPENAILITEGDTHSFALWYVRYGLGERLDITIVDRWFLGGAWYRAHLEELDPALKLPVGGTITGSMLASRTLSYRPIAVTERDRWDIALRDGKLISVVVPAP